MFWLDILLMFSTGIVRERECLIECVSCSALLAALRSSDARATHSSYRRTALARAYVFRGTFVADVLSALPLGAMQSAFGGGTGGTGALAFKLLRLPRLLRLSRLLKKARACSVLG